MGHRKVWENRRNHFGWEVHQTQRIIFQPCLSTGCEFLWLPVLCFSHKTRVVFSEFQTISLVASRLSSGWTPSETQLVGFPHGLPYPKQYKSLVGGDWNHGILNDFLYIGNFIIPTDELIFFRVVAQPPTRIYWGFSRSEESLSEESLSTDDTGFWTFLSSNWSRDEWWWAEDQIQFHGVQNSGVWVL